MLAFPNAKVNVGLNILERREDGYHNIQSCICPVPWSDVLEVVPASDFKFTQTGLGIAGDPQDNLCLKAHQLLDEAYGIGPVSIHLHKVIPMGAGLGGGSSDGAFMLKMLNDLFELRLSVIELENFASKLGSDCPFFIRNVPAMVTGTGTVLEPVAIAWRNFQVGIAYPQVHVSTKEAYQAITPQLAADLKGKIERPPEEWQGLVSNDFQLPISKKYGEIKKALTLMEKQEAIYYSMTGSGSAVFGIFSKEREIDPSVFDFWGRLDDL